jgi:PhzF family phenazine biosynthesis protein
MPAFKQVDVFTALPFFGNPVAVILDARALDTAAMQRIANWTNLSETAFLLPPGSPAASYQVRIFTPRQELPFAGHPSVGAAHAVLEAGLAQPVDGMLVQECAAGLLPVRVEGDAALRVIHVRAPKASFTPPDLAANDRLAEVLGGPAISNVPAQIVCNGPFWWVIGLQSGAAVRRLQPDMHALAALTTAHGAVGIAVYGPADGPDHELVVRCFCPADGIPEDPVTGSGNAAITAYLQAHGLQPAARYRASQGREMGRDGILQMSVEADGIYLGGNAITVIEGSLRA